jgi:hypothetical protein
MENSRLSWQRPQVRRIGAVAPADELQADTPAPVAVGDGVERVQLCAHRRLVPSRDLLDQVVVSEVEKCQDLVTDDVQVPGEPG